MKSRRRVNSTVMRLHLVKPTTIISTALLLCFVRLPAITQSRSVDSLDKEVLDLFAGYPQTNDLKVIVYSHAHRESMEKSGTTFYSTWFLAGNLRVMMATLIDDDREVFTYPLQNSEVGPTHSRWKRQPDVDSPSFLAMLRTLPETTSGVELANLVIVSFRLDGKWQTRLYDRTKAPTQLVNLYRLVRAPLDAK